MTDHGKSLLTILILAAATYAAAQTNGPLNTGTACKWSVVNSPNASTDNGDLNTLREVSGFSSSDLYAVGFFGNSSSGQPETWWSTSTEQAGASSPAQRGIWRSI